MTCSPRSGSGSLAGSACSQLEMVRALVAAGVVGPADALSMASSAPARALGLEGQLGVLRVGAAADLVVLRGADLALERVLVAGHELPRPSGFRADRPIRPA